MTAPYPLRFEPIFRSMIWGGTRLKPWLAGETTAEPIGEAWVLSDVEGAESVVQDGPWQGWPFRKALGQNPHAWFGDKAPADGRFPLLLKFIDAQRELSVQVHPNDDQAKLKFPDGRGKTEAWVIMESNPQASRIYAGLRQGMSVERMQKALADKTAASTLHSFIPKPGDCVFLPAGTVHAIGAEILLFEVQQTSDITYRLYDWDRVDAKTGLPRPLHIEDAIACTDFAKGPCNPTIPVNFSDEPAKAERLAQCEYFELQRYTSLIPFPISGRQILVCTKGTGRLQSSLASYPLKPGAVFLLPEGDYQVHPEGSLEMMVIDYGC